MLLTEAVIWCKIKARVRMTLSRVVLFAYYKPHRGKTKIAYSKNKSALKPHRSIKRCEVLVI